MLLETEPPVYSDFPMWLIPQEVDSIEIIMPQEEEEELEGTASNDQLFEAKKNFITFSQNLRQHKKSELRPDVLAHCGQLNRVKKVIPNYISDETILRMVSSRIDKMLKNRKIKKNWSEEDLKILVWTVSKYADKHCLTDLLQDITHQDWKNIATLIPGVTAASCMFKWLGIKKVNLSVKSWAEYEADMLRMIVEQQLSIPSVKANSLNWKIISERLYKINPMPEKVFRSAKQCRQHWNCYLNPYLKKGPWKIEQDIKLLWLIYGNNGQKKWSQIVYSFQGRTQNALKNRYTLLIQKQKKLSKSKQERSLVQDCLAKCRQLQAGYSKQHRSMFVNDVLEGDLSDKKIEEGGNAGEGNELMGIQDHRGDSQTVVETPSAQPVVIKFFKTQQFDMLKQMALSHEMRPGFVRNNVFQPSRE